MPTRRKFREGYCGHCHHVTIWRKGTGTAWRIWLCDTCGSMTRKVEGK